MKRRSFLAAAAAAPVGLMLPDIGFAMQQGELETDVGRALAAFRKTIPSNFDHDYVEHAVIPFFLTTIFDGERPALPMIDVTLTKENALPYDLWGLIYKKWKPTPEEGVTVFYRGSSIVGITTSASASTRPRSRPTCTARCTRRK